MLKLWHIIYTSLRLTFGCTEIAMMLIFTTSIVGCVCVCVCVLILVCSYSLFGFLFPVAWLWPIRFHNVVSWQWAKVFMAVNSLAGEITVFQVLRFVVVFDGAWSCSRLIFWDTVCVDKMMPACREQTLTQIHMLSYSFCERKQQTSRVAALKSVCPFYFCMCVCACLAMFVCTTFRQISHFGNEPYMECVDAYPLCPMCRFNV